jgi:L-threonylcarbamoyladenylate synthase
MSDSSLSLVVHDRLTPHGLLSLDAVEACVRQLRTAGLLVLPTETGYMLAGDATDEQAIEAVFAAKGRSRGNPIHVAVDGLPQIEACVLLPEAGLRVCLRLMPGPVTVIGENRSAVPEALVAHTGTLGVRIPDSPVTLQVLSAFGGPVTATSLNPSGVAPSPDPREAISELVTPADAPVHLVVDAGAVTYAQPSTLVRFASDSWEILRHGPVAAEEIAAALSGP